MTKSYLHKFLNSPSLFLYSMEITSFFSIWLRISGFITLIVILILPILYNMSFYYNINALLTFSEYFSSEYFFGSHYIFEVLFLIIVPYHIFFGIKYIAHHNNYNVKLLKDQLHFSEYYETAGSSIAIIIAIIYVFMF